MSATSTEVIHRSGLAGVSGTARRVAATPRVSRTTTSFFLLFAAYLACPVLELPLVGLSLSAPIFYVIAVRIYVAEGGVSADGNRHWYVFAFVFWTALVGSLTGNLLADPAFVVEPADIAMLVRFAYWLLVFVATAHLVSTIDEPRRVAMALALGIVALAGVRLVEVVLFGNWGAWTGTRFMAQNEYGLQFSIFAPFALSLPLIARGRARWLVVPALALIAVAVAGNGSRSSWIALAVAVVALVVLAVLSGHARVRQLWPPIALVALMAVAAPIVLPGQVLAPVVQRYETFQRLDTDRSYQIRLLMVQKSMRLFEQSPVFGAGIGRFHRTTVELDRPGILGRSEGIYNRRSSHNSYAGLFGETGLIGTVPFAVLFLTLVAGGGRAAIRLARAGETWALAVYVSLLTMSVHLVAIAALTNTTVWFIYGMVAGLIGRSRSPGAVIPREG